MEIKPRKIQLGSYSRAIHGGAYFSAVFGRKFNPTTVLRPCQPLAWYWRAFSPPSVTFVLYFRSLLCSWQLFKRISASEVPQLPWMSSSKWVGEPDLLLPTIQPYVLHFYLYFSHFSSVFLRSGCDVGGVSGTIGFTVGQKTRQKSGNCGDTLVYSKILGSNTFSKT